MGCLMDKTLSKDAPLFIFRDALLPANGVLNTAMFLVLYYTSADQVNATKGKVFLVANISVTVVTFAINLWAGLSILKKEKTRLHFLIVCDCVVNIVSCVQTSFLQSPWSILSSPSLCLLNTFAMMLLTAWNRLVPLAIAAFRYIMVCHAVFVQNHGGEKQVITWVKFLVEHQVFGMVGSLFWDLSP